MWMVLGWVSSGCSGWSIHLAKLDILLCTLGTYDGKYIDFCSIQLFNCPFYSTSSHFTMCSNRHRQLNDHLILAFISLPGNYYLSCHHLCPSLHLFLLCSLRTIWSVNRCGHCHWNRLWIARPGGGCCCRCGCGGSSCTSDDVQAPWRRKEILVSWSILYWPWCRRHESFVNPVYGCLAVEAKGVLLWPWKHIPQLVEILLKNL